MKVVVVNTGVCNIGAIPNMLRRLSIEPEICNDPAGLTDAGCLILPGVGSFDAAVDHLQASGLWDALDRHAQTGTPILGICLGMQLMAEGSEEGQKPGFGWIKTRLQRFRPEMGGAKPLRVPHMGWNLITSGPDDLLYAGIEAPRFYFDHSYFMPLEGMPWCHGSTRYAVEFAAGIRKGNIFGVQFHPEKSHRFGLSLFRNFIAFANGG